ncbi:MAG: hypothetical protein M3439_06660, partial [Chloroflexota bacterium]|nr:hypothetical protein [Chloroflexota bacterium]
PMVQTHAEGPHDHERVITTPGSAYTTSVTDPDVVNRKDRTRWGPIVAGLLTAVVTLLVLTVLGLAIGTSAFEPDTADGSTVGTAAAIWGGVSALIAFFVGGWVAAKSSAIDGDGAGALNGFLVGVAAIVLILWLLGAGLGNLLGTVGNNLTDVINLGQTVDVPEGQDATTIAQESYDEARNSAWGTLVGLLLALGAATLGGWAGHNHGVETIRSGGRGVGTNRTRATG